MSREGIERTLVCTALDTVRNGSKTSNPIDETRQALAILCQLGDMFLSGELTRVSRELIDAKPDVKVPVPPQARLRSTMWPEIEMDERKPKD